MSRVFIASDLLNKFSQFLMYALCLLLMLSIGYDMAYAFLKIIDRGADFLYVTIFTALALIQSFFLFSMVYAVITQSHKVASCLGRYLFFMPLLLVILYALTNSEDLFIFAAYVLPMFHKISNDLSVSVFLSIINIKFLDKIIWIFLILSYAITLLFAAKNYKIPKITKK
jgi:hypothetical protein